MNAPMLLTVLLAITVGAEALSTLAIIISITAPHRRIWPPMQANAWGQAVMLALFAISGVGGVLLGVLDRDSAPFAVWVRVGPGLALWLGGLALALWAVITLGFAPTSGEEGPLTRRGPYGFSRNPQYVAFIAMLIGWPLLAASWLTLVAGLAGIVPLVLVPFAEEPWLRERHGSAFDAYVRSVPRFLGLPRAKDG